MKLIYIPIKLEEMNFSNCIWQGNRECFRFCGEFLNSLPQSIPRDQCRCGGGVCQWATALLLLICSYQKKKVPTVCRHYFFFQMRIPPSVCSYDWLAWMAWSCLLRLSNTEWLPPLIDYIDVWTYIQNTQILVAFVNGISASAVAFSK